MLSPNDGLVAPLIVDDRLREAETRRLLRALPPSPGPAALLEERLGHLFVAVGRRLQAAAARRRAGTAWTLSADLCAECGD
jgi:hypothetical protein